MKNTLIAVIVIVVVAIGALFFAPDFRAPAESGEANEEAAAEEVAEETQEEEEPEGEAQPGVPAIEEGEQEEESEPQATQSQSANVVIEYLGDSFSPSNVSISRGDTITFINRSDRGMWPASDVHPTHTVYPGSSIGKCGSSEESLIFDSCASLGNGAPYEFTFTEVGTWRYHNHVRASHGGVITVE